MKRVKQQHARRVSKTSKHAHISHSHTIKRSKEQPLIYKQQSDQPVPQPARGQQILRYVADSTCLLIGMLMFLWTHDILAFLLMYGIATGQIQVREIMGMFPLKFQKKEIKQEESPQDNW